MHPIHRICKPTKRNDNCQWLQPDLLAFHLLHANRALTSPTPCNFPLGLTLIPMKCAGLRFSQNGSGGIVTSVAKILDDHISICISVILPTRQRRNQQRGFPLRKYFIPGCVGRGLDLDLRIRPAASGNPGYTDLALLGLRSKNKVFELSG